MTDAIADKYEAVRRALIPVRNKMKDEFNKTRLTTLIENCTEIAKSLPGTRERLDLIAMFHRNRADTERYVGKLPPYGG